VDWKYNLKTHKKPTTAHETPQISPSDTNEIQQKANIKLKT